MSEHESISVQLRAKDPKSWAIKWTDAAGAAGLGTARWRWADNSQAWAEANMLGRKFPGMKYQVVPSSLQPNWDGGFTVDALGSLRSKTGKSSGKFAHGVPVYALRIRYPDGSSKLGAAWTTRERAVMCMGEVERAYPDHGYSIELHVGEPAPGQELQPGLYRVIQEMNQPESGPGLALAEPGAGSATYAWPPPGHNPSRYAPEAQKPVDPLDVKYDGWTLRQLLDHNEKRRREDWALAHQYTPAQRDAISAHWSMQLRAKVHAAKEKERTQVVCDVWGDDD